MSIGEMGFFTQSSYEEAVKLLEALKEEKIPSGLQDEIQT